jgi:site-specific recombinase XerD
MNQLLLVDRCQTGGNVRRDFERQRYLEDLEIHPHMLRHACGYSLANRGADTRLIQDYLGHKNIRHTVRYTKLAPGRFTGLF